MRYRDREGKREREREEERGRERERGVYELKYVASSIRIHTIIG